MVKSHAYCSFCYTSTMREFPQPVVSEEEREALTRQYLEAKDLLAELNRVSPRRSRRKDLLPKLLVSHMDGRETFTIRGFRATEEGVRFRIQHVWRTLDKWVKAGHVEKVGKGVYRKKEGFDEVERGSDGNGSPEGQDGTNVGNDQLVEDRNG